MVTALFVLLVIAAVDVTACGVFITAVWVAAARQRRAARAAGEHMPRSPTGDFLLLGSLLLVVFAPVGAGLALLLRY